MHLEFKFKGQDFLLLPDKAIYWKQEEALLIADLHLGKITHFRKAGIPLPTEPEQKNWANLSKLIHTWEPKQILLLGDLFHSDYNNQWQKFCEITEIYNDTKWILIKGNHDILGKQAYELSNMEICPSSLEMGPFLLTHEPTECPEDMYNLCGHIHPGVRLIGTARQSLRLPIFYFGEKFGILPAFGAFTGLHIIQPEETDEIFIITKNEVMNASALIDSNT